MKKLNTKPTTVDGTLAVPIQFFGKDHWSLLGYIGSCASHGGNSGVASLDKERLRCNPSTHQIHAVSARINRNWDQSYGTRLAGYWRKDNTIDKSCQLPEHDDWDVLDDLEAAGIIDVIGEANALVAITPAGLRVYGALCAHKAAGKNYSEFTWAK